MSTLAHLLYTLPSHLSSEWQFLTHLLYDESTAKQVGDWLILKEMRFWRFMSVNQSWLQEHPAVWAAIKQPAFLFSLFLLLLLYLKGRHAEPQGKHHGLFGWLLHIFTRHPSLLLCLSGYMGWRQFELTPRDTVLLLFNNLTMLLSLCPVDVSLSGVGWCLFLWWRTRQADKNTPTMTARLRHMVAWCRQESQWHAALFQRQHCNALCVLGGCLYSFEYLPPAELGFGMPALTFPDDDKTMEHNTPVKPTQLRRSPRLLHRH